MSALDALPPQLQTDASGRLQLAFVVSGETDHKMGQASIGIASEAVSNGGGRTSEPCLCLFHYFAATGIVGFQKLSNARFRARDVIVDADGQIHRTVERVRVAPPFAPHRPHLLPLLAKNFGRGRDREPAVEVALIAFLSCQRPSQLIASPVQRARHSRMHSRTLPTRFSKGTPTAANSAWMPGRSGLIPMPRISR